MSNLIFTPMGQPHTAYSMNFTTLDPTGRIFTEDPVMAEEKKEIIKRIRKLFPREETCSKDSPTISE